MMMPGNSVVNSVGAKFGRMEEADNSVVTRRTRDIHKSEIRQQTFSLESKDSVYLQTNVSTCLPLSPAQKVMTTETRILSRLLLTNEK